MPKRTLPIEWLALKRRQKLRTQFIQGTLLSCCEAPCAQHKRPNAIHAVCLTYSTRIV
jgi:hypothetical protein